MPRPLSTIVLVSLLATSTVQSGSSKNNCYLESDVQVRLGCTGDLPKFNESEYPQISRVEQLSLKRCTFSAIPGHCFAGFDAMKWLYISCTKEIPTLTIDEDALQPLESLEQIIIRNNSIRTLPPKLFANLPRLRLLDLSYNLLNDTDDLGFGPRTCTSAVCGPVVQRLNLIGNRIRRLPSRAFFTLKNLTSLDLGDNGLRYVDDEALANLERLRTLYLMNNNLTYLSSKVLQHLTHLKIIDLEGNPLLNLGEVFGGPSTLKSILLANASIDSLGPDFFTNQTEVNVLVMDHNCLESIDEEAFMPLNGRPQLEGNSCSSRSAFFEDDGIGSIDTILEKNINVHLSGVRVLSLDSTCLVSVPPISFLNRVEAVSLHSNGIQNLTDDDFSNMTRMLLLDVSSNRLQNIGKNSFRRLLCLKILNLASNSIASLHPSTFEDNFLLSELYLQYNRLSTIDGLFAKNRRLVKLALSNNRIRFVSFDMFPKNLKELYLMSNFIWCLGYDTPPLVHMSDVDLSENVIVADPTFYSFTSFTEVSVKNSCIANMTGCILCSSGAITAVDVQNDRVATADLGWLNVSRQNPLWCDCSLELLRNAMFRKMVVDVVNNVALSCPRRYPMGESGLQFKISSAFAPKDFLCRIGPTLGEPCTVYETGSRNLVVVCSGANLTSVPKSISTRANRLFLDGNRLGSLPNGTFASLTSLTELNLKGSFVTYIEDGAFLGLANLTILHLENNALQSIGSSIFAGLGRLSRLYLSSNELRHIDEDAFLPAPFLRILHLDDNRLTLFPVWRFRDSKHLKEVRLSGNPWSCDCDYMENYRHWLQDFLVIVDDAHDLLCSYADGNTTEDVSIVAFNVSHCYGTTTTTILQSPGFPLLVTALVLVVVLTSLGVLLYLYRREIQVVVYSRYGRRIFCCRKNAVVEDADKLFDAFVGYSNDDEAFVAEQLVPGLEKIGRPYQLCLHHRDFLVGGFIIDTIMEAVDKSRRSILVLTDSFVRSEWCRFEFKTAHIKMLEDGCHRLILIVLGEIPKNLDREMKLYLKTNTYLKWGDRLFWEKLYFVMPDRSGGPIRPPGATFIGQ